MFQKIIGLFLHIANSSPPFLWKDEFYSIKRALLKRYGAFVGREIQHIEKTCYTCDGTGIYYYYRSWDGSIHYKELCYRCKNGIYAEYWVLLDKFKLGKYYFHIPRGRTTVIKEGEQVIKGYIKHAQYKHHLTDECSYWLALLFYPRLFLRHFGKIRHCGAKYTPMVILNNTIFNIKRLYTMACDCVGRFMLRPEHDREELPF